MPWHSLMFTPCRGIVKEYLMDRLTFGPLALGLTRTFFKLIVIVPETIQLNTIQQMKQYNERKKTIEEQFVGLDTVLYFICGMQAN